MEKIVFKIKAEEEVKLWIYDGGNPEAQKNRPAMLWIHGGGWNSGDPDYFGDDYGYFTKLGIVCFGVEYRLVSKTENDPMATRLYGALEDCMDAYVYIKENADKFGIDPEKIIVLGESAGGHLALCFATDIVNRLNKNALPPMVVAFNPVVETLDRWSNDAAGYKGISFTKEELAERFKALKNISPYHNIVSNNIPLLLLTGIDDPVVFPTEVMAFYERYLQVGNTAQLELYEKTTHAFALPAWYDRGTEIRDRSMEDIKTFLKKYS